MGEVERLGREYRIVTPYTSHLVVEPGLRVAGLGGRGSFRGPSDSAVPGPRSTGQASAVPLTREEHDALRGLGYSGPARDDTGAAGSWLGSGTPPVPEPTLVALAGELKSAGVLPPEASGAELAWLTERVARELRASEQRLGGLATSVSGDQAVDDSQYLAGLVARGRPAGAASLVELFSRRVLGKTFVLRQGVWTDQCLGEAPPAERELVEAFSPEYFALLAREPGLAPYLALGARVLVGLDGHVVEVIDPRRAAEGR